MSIIIKGGNVVLNDSIQAADILIQGDQIIKIGESKDFGVKDAQIIDATDLMVLPGLIDMHVHLREPGLEYKEDIESGSKAAAAGGFTAVACMPNTKPVVDNVPLIQYIKQRSSQVGLTKVLPIGAVTKGQKGVELAEMRLMQEAGAVAFSDDGVPVDNAQTMRLALEYAKDFDGLIISHCEDLALADGGSVNEGYNATIAGLKGISRTSEEVMAARDIIIAASLNAHIHIAHVSTKGTAEIIRHAKQMGVQVTAETCPQYLTATDAEILDYNTNAKINPPLRTEMDRLALIEAVKDGTIDVLVTDHAPHHIDDKNVEFALAAFGSVGLESAVGIYVSKLIDTGIIDWIKFAQMASTTPAKILRLADQGEIRTGALADITIINPHDEYVFDTAKTYSKSKNSLFKGWVLKGRVITTINDGKIVYRYNE